MKKIIFLLLAVCVIGPVSAQTSAFGVKAGINTASVFAPEVDVNGRTGFVGGFFYALEGKKVGFQAEMLYSMQGFKQENERYITEIAKLNYLDIPLICKFYPVHFFSVDFGFQTSVLLNTGKLKQDTKYGHTDDLPGMRSVNHALVLGLTFRLWEHFDLSARYNLGMSDLENKKEGSMVRSRVGQFTVGYRF